MQSRSPFVAKKKGRKKKKWRNNEKGRVTERCKVYTGDQVRNYFRHAFSVRGFKLNSKFFPGKVWIAHAQKNTHYFRLKLVVFLNFVLKASACRVFTTKSTNNTDKKYKQLCTAVRRVWARPTMCSFDTVGIDSARKTPGWAFGQNHRVMSSGDQYSCIQSWTTKKRRKSFTNTPFLAVFSVSRSRLSVATATRSSSAGLEGTLSFLPNGRTSNLPTSKNRVGIRFSVDWECRLLVYRWWQREVTIWALGRRTSRGQKFWESPILRLQPIDTMVSILPPSLREKKGHRGACAQDTYGGWKKNSL